jgi:WhiB family transcriptional regulator, redox-sensing transcriptional regulator
MVKKIIGRLPRWDQRACRDADPELFFMIEEWDKIPHPGQSALCSTCEIMTRCLEWALQNNEKYGVWGNTTPYQRKQLLRDIHRVRCIGCGGFDIMITGDVELCVSCGLSWCL